MVPQIPNIGLARRCRSSSSLVCFPSWQCISPYYLGFANFVVARGTFYLSSPVRKEDYPLCNVQLSFISFSFYLFPPPPPQQEMSHCHTLRCHVDSFWVKQVLRGSSLVAASCSAAAAAATAVTISRSAALYDAKLMCGARKIVR